jgi:hypothetical protein
MSTEDIRIKLQADESGAVNSFRKLRTEVLNNEQGLKRLSDQGKITGKALMDVSGSLGPEFGMLGSSVDKVTGALKNMHGASMFAKAGLAGMVLVGAFEVGKMLGDFIFATEEWKRTHDETTKQILKNMAFLNKKSQSQFDKELEAINLAATEEQRLAEARELRMRVRAQQTEAELDLIEREKELRVALANDMLGYGTEDNALAEQSLAAARERLRMITRQREAVEQLLNPTQSHLDMVIAQRKEAQQADKLREAENEKKAAEQAKEAARAQQLVDSQEDYLFGLEAELVKIKESEEAYMRLTLAKRGFTDETINSAIALRAEIDQLNKEKKAKDDKDAKVGSVSVSAPGQVQATQQRFITRGTGMTGQEKILAETKKQIELQLAEQKRVARILEDRLPRVTY